MTEQEILNDVSIVKATSDSPAMERLIAQFQPMIIKLAKKYGSISMEDSVQDGYFALFKAAKEFDEDKNTKFITFAYTYIEDLIKREVHKRRDITHGVTYPMNGFGGIKEDADFVSRTTFIPLSQVGILGDNSGSEQIFSSLSHDEIQNRIEYLIAVTSARPTILTGEEISQSVLMARMYLGLEDGSHWSVRQISHSLGVPLSKVKSRIAKYLKALKEDQKLRQMVQAA